MGYNRWIRRSSCLVVAVVVAVVVTAAPALAVKRRAFVTSVSGNGNLSSWPDAGGNVGLAAGDAICRVRAAAAGLPNATTYRAWLSSATTDAYCHVKGLSGLLGACTGGPGDAAGPWYLVNGVTPFTGTLDELVGPAHVILRAVQRDEFNASVDWSTAGIWTGTRSGGNQWNETCQGWTSDSASGSVGDALSTVEDWTHAAQQGCAFENRLLCLEPGASDAWVPFWWPSALVFATSATGTGDLGAWPQAGAATGLAAGDAICRSLAAAAHLPAPQSFVAWLSSDAVNAVDRLTTDDSFARVDGNFVAMSKADLVDGIAANSIHQDESGRYLESPVGFVWTGSQGIGTWSGSDCGVWTASDSGVFGTVGLPNHVLTDWWTDVQTNWPCNQPSRLYCFSNVVTLFWDGFDYTDDTSRWSSTTP